MSREHPIVQKIRNLEAERERLLLKDYTEHELTVSDLAIKYGLSRSGVSRLANSKGLHRPHTEYFKGPEVYNHPAILHDYSMGMKPLAIAKKHGIRSRQTVANIIQAHKKRCKL